jgi:GH3 auxin-responsive promoter
LPLLNSIASWLMVKRLHQIDLFRKHPHEVQIETFLKLIESGRETEFGSKYNFENIENIEQFRREVPIQSYEELKPWIERLRRGEQFLLWPTEVKWFAKSSGTTSDKSKFIPVTEESLRDCHYKGGKDMITLYCSNYPEHQLFTGKNLALGGSHQTDYFDRYETYHGDVSAIIIQNLPLWADFFRAPSVEIALLSEWEEKLEKMARSTMEENVVSLSGVPSWMIVLLRRILEITGKKKITEVWPNLELYYHGGINYSPYRKQIDELIGKEIATVELYNASEGFFGIQDQAKSDEMLLMLDYGIYYEFMPSEEWANENGKTILLDELVLGKSYALIISTTGGLWRYNTGDTIEFTSLDPYRFRITGRTKHFINVFGEEVMIGNAEQALQIACSKTEAQISEYTVAPIFMDQEGKQGAHEWLIEFSKEPESISYFAELLDNALKSVNSDYEAKRYHNFVLQAPQIQKASTGTFYRWLRSKEKLGGQHKVPRLSNERKVLEEVMRFV